jgi:SAM-dependent methyltransferase
MKPNDHNPYLSFYGKNKISPVTQDLSNFSLHLLRREKLYRTLGIPIIAFERKSILEVGCGGGYNTLAFLIWGAHMDLVEPNSKAREEIEPLFTKHGVDLNQWKLYDATIETFNLQTGYDVVIAEGFLQCIPNKAQVVDKLSAAVKNGGVVVVTCADDISFFFELLKRIIGFRLIQIYNEDRFTGQVELLSKAFASHLDSLQFASRPVNDWVIDNLVNPEPYGDFLSIADCIDLFNNEFEFLGSSPRMFTEYSWYKDVQSDQKCQVKERFYTNWHRLLMVGMPESVRSKGENIRLKERIYALRQCIEEHGNRIDERNHGAILRHLEKVGDLAAGMDPRILKVIKEVSHLLCDDALTPEKVSNAEHFKTAFGCGQQYVSMVKNHTPNKQG